MLNQKTENQIKLVKPCNKLVNCLLNDLQNIKRYKFVYSYKF